MCKRGSIFINVIIILIFLCPNRSFPQVGKFFSKDSAEVAGNWKGSSICQVKGSSCRDEILVYNILLSDSAVYHVAMNKIVNGKVDFIGVVDLTYDSSARTLSALDAGRIWQFTLKNNVMEGILLWRGQLYRKLHLEKE